MVGQQRGQVGEVNAAAVVEVGPRVVVRVGLAGAVRREQQRQVVKVNVAVTIDVTGIWRGREDPDLRAIKIEIGSLRIAASLPDGQHTGTHRRVDIGSAALRRGVEVSLGQRCGVEQYVVEKHFQLNGLRALAVLLKDGRRVAEKRVWIGFILGEIKVKTS